MLEAKKGHGPLCLACDTEFSREEPPEAFAITRPACADQGIMVVTGICVRCEGYHTDDHLMRLVPKGMGLGAWTAQPDPSCGTPS